MIWLMTYLGYFIDLYRQVPQQENGYDCGVYVQRFAQYVIEEWPTSTREDQNSRWDKFVIILSLGGSSRDIASTRLTPVFR